MSPAIERRLWVALLAGAFSGAAVLGLSAVVPFARGDEELELLNPVDDLLMLRLILSSLVWTLIAAVAWARTWQRTLHAPAPQRFWLWSSSLAALVGVTTLATHLVPFTWANVALSGQSFHSVFIPQVHQLTLEPGLVFWLFGLGALVRPAAWRVVVAGIVASALHAFVTPVVWRLVDGQQIPSEILRRSAERLGWSVPAWLAMTFALGMVLPRLRLARRSAFLATWSGLSFGVAAVVLLSLRVVSWGPLRATLPEFVALATPVAWLVGILARLSRETEVEAAG